MLIMLPGDIIIQMRGNADCRPENNVGMTPVCASFRLQDLRDIVENSHYILLSSVCCSRGFVKRMKDSFRSVIRNTALLRSGL